MTGPEQRLLCAEQAVGRSFCDAAHAYVANFASTRRWFADQVFGCSFCAAMHPYASTRANV